MASKKSYTLLEYLVTIEMELKKLKKIVAESVGADYSELIANIDGIRNELNTFKTSITNTVDNNNTNLTSKLNSLEQQFNTFKTSITNTVNSNISEITSQVNTLSTNFNAFKTSIESQVSSLNTRVTSVERRVTTLENSGGSSGGSSGSVDLTEVNDRISTAEGNITTLQSDVTSLKGRVTTLENNGGSTGGSQADTIVEKPISNAILNLGTEKYQKCIIQDLTKINLPTVTSFTEIHLFFSTSEALTLVLPSCKWQSQPSIEANKDYEFIFTYTDRWLGGCIVYE